jgi:N-glycosylase/DNA lyase
MKDLPLWVDLATGTVAFAFTAYLTYMVDRRIALDHIRQMESDLTCGRVPRYSGTLEQDDMLIAGDFRGEEALKAARQQMERAQTWGPFSRYARWNALRRIDRAYQEFLDQITFEPVSSQ